MRDSTKLAIKALFIALWPLIVFCVGIVLSILSSLAWPGTGFNMFSMMLIGAHIGVRLKTAPDEITKLDTEIRRLCKIGM